ncbi:hypothetical protein F9B74_09695 [Pelistega sp. NLN82]|uniref:Uncharacterized protein n=1 Tax=Pelistega ratti TaxID=2652177 RepID=A0A6L9Y873_9BURK|nr:hypothetical protein [Pelistega ratti]NEN76576.1 hypothetical protein [Pelistega ratti]
MKNQHFIFFNQDIPKNLTGIESSAFKRYGLFEQQFGIRPLFLTARYNPSYLVNAQRWINEGRIPQDFRCDNLYTYFQHNGAKANPEAIYYRPKSLETYRHIIFHGNQKICVQYFNQDTQKLAYTHYFDEKERVIRLDNYDFDGFLSRTVFSTLMRKGKDKEKLNFFIKSMVHLVFINILFKKMAKPLFLVS